MSAGKGGWIVDIEFLVPGNPQALKRHRTGRFGNYDPSAVAKENFLLLALEYRPSAPVREALQVAMQFRFSRPKSHFRGKNHELRADAPYWHTGRPDVDNLQKFVMDALNGTFWHDDCIIASVKAEKVYHTVPGISVHIQDPS